MEKDIWEEKKKDTKVKEITGRKKRYHHEKINYTKRSHGLWQKYLYQRKRS